MTEVTETVWTNHYLCSCGSTWRDQSECCGNDRCPNCNKEIEPFIFDDGSVSALQIEAGLEATLAKLDDLDAIKRLSQRLLLGDDVPDGQYPECGALSYRVKAKEQLFIVLHQHEFGTSAYLALAPREPTLDESVKAFKIDFEPEKDVIEVVVPDAPVRIEVAR